MSRIRAFRAVALVLGGVVVFVLMVVVWCAVQLIRADREYASMQRRLNTSLDPVVALGRQLKEDLRSGKVLSVDDVERRISGYSKKAERNGSVYYLYFVKNYGLIGRYGSYIRATYSDNGVLEEVYYDTSELLTMRGGTSR